MEEKGIKKVIIMFIFLFIGIGAILTLLGSITGWGTVLFEGIIPGAICFFIAGGFIILLIIFEVKVEYRENSIK